MKILCIPCSGIRYTFLNLSFAEVYFLLSFNYRLENGFPPLVVQLKSLFFPAEIYMVIYNNFNIKNTISVCTSLKNYGVPGPTWPSKKWGTFWKFPQSASKFVKHSDVHWKKTMQFSNDICLDCQLLLKLLHNPL